MRLLGTAELGFSKLSCILQRKTTNFIYTIQCRAENAVKKRSEILMGCEQRVSAEIMRNALKYMPPSLQAKGPVQQGCFGSFFRLCISDRHTSLPGQAQSFPSAISSSDLACHVQILQRYHPTPVFMEEQPCSMR